MSEVVRREVVVQGARLSLLAPAGADIDEVPDLLLLHGVPASAELWRDVIALLAEQGRTAFAPDLVGYGRTEVPETWDHSLRGSADLLEAWLHGRGAPWVVGHDLGGAVAQLLAVHHPRAVGALTLGDTVVGDSWPVRPVRVLRAMARARLFCGVAAVGLARNPWTDWELRQGFSSPEGLADGPVADRVFWDAKLGDGRGKFARHLRALDTAQTLEVVDGLGRIDAPVSLVWGDSDVFQSWGEVGTRLAELLPEPSTRLVRDTGHFAPLEQPERYVTALLADDLLAVDGS